MNLNVLFFVLLAFSLSSTLFICWIHYRVSSISNPHFIQPPEKSKLQENGEVKEQQLKEVQTIVAKSETHFSSRPQLSWKHQLMGISQSLVLVACTGDSCNQTQVRNYKWAVPYDTTLHRTNSSINDTLHMLSTLSNHPLSASNNNWIGVISHTNPISSTLNMSLVDMMLSDKQLINDGIDVIGFLDISRPDSSFSKIMDESCPGMNQTLRYILMARAIDEDSDKFESIYSPSSIFPIFHGEFFAARPTAMRSFIKWLEPVTQLLSSLSASRPGLHFLHKEGDVKNARCKLSLLQLLASYYFNANMARIVTNNGYTKILNDIGNSAAKEFNAQSLHNIKLGKNESKSIVFILCHHQPSCNRAVDNYANFSWSYPYMIPSTFYFEAYFYSNILLEIMDSANFSDDMWVGSISWKTKSKFTDFDKIPSMLVDESIEADVLGFWDVSTGAIWDQADFFHPGLMDLMVYVLQSIGESMNDIEKLRLSAPSFKSFFGTYFVTRPSHMRIYIEWISRVINFIATDRKAQNMIWKDSRYAGNRDAARKIFDLEYYPMHPFLVERLVQYFFNARGYKIMTAGEYKGSQK